MTLQDLAQSIEVWEKLHQEIIHFREQDSITSQELDRAQQGISAAFDIVEKLREMAGDLELEVDWTSEELERILDTVPIRDSDAKPPSENDS